MTSFLTLKKIFEMKLTSLTQSKVRTDLLKSSTVHPYHGDFSPLSQQYILFQPCRHLRGGHRISLNARSLWIQFTLYEFPVTVMALSDYTQKAPFPFEERARDCKVNVVYVRSKSKNNFYLKWRLHYRKYWSLVCLRYYNVMVQVISLDDSWEAPVYSTLAFISSWTFRGI